MVFSFNPFLDVQRKLNGDMEQLLNYSALEVAQMVKDMPTVQKPWVQSLGWEDPLKEGMATRSRILAWRVPWTEENPMDSGLLQGHHKESDTAERLTLPLSFLD